MWKRLVAILQNIPENLMMVMLVMMVVLANLEVIYRYIFKSSVMSGIDEALRLLLIWVAYLGAAVAVKRGGHFSVTVLVEKVPTVHRKAVAVFVQLSVAAFGCVLLLKGTQATEKAFSQTLHGLDISVGWMYVSAPVASALIIVYCVANLIELWQKG